MKGAYVLAGIRLGLLLRLIFHGGTSFGVRYLFRLLFLVQGSFWSSVFALRERLKTREKIERATMPSNPVFIVGHWRTGSTFLHQLLALDPQLVAPSLFQCSFPDSFLTARKYIAPVFAPMTRGRRPMDNVKMGIDEPQEDEFALFRMSGLSPLQRLVFPRSGDFFLLDDETFLPVETRRGEWERALRLFVTKLHLESGRRPVLKNPFHSLRIPLLKKMFPDAAFIHIYRNPLAVIPSSLHMWSVVGSQNAMRRRWRPPSVDELITVFDCLLSKVRGELRSLPEERFAEVRFEDLERDPIDSLRAVYRKFNLEFTDGFEERIAKFQKDNANYQKNKYSIAEQDEELVRSRLAAHMARDGY